MDYKFNDRNKFGVTFFKRLFRLLPWLFPSGTSKPVCLFILLVCLGLLEQYVIYNLGMVPSKYYKVLGDRDQDGFWKQTAIAMALIVSEALIKATTTFLTSFLYLIWRSSITQRLHNQYFTEVVYYTINVLDKAVDNPDQRITQDVNKLCDKLSQIVAPILISPFTIGYYIYKSQESSGYIGPVGCIVFFIIATVINKLLMSPVVRFVFLQEKMEGNFRYKHMQIRSYCESAAFYRSGHIELVKTNQHLAKLINTQHQLIRREYLLNIAVNLFDYLGSILSYIAIAVPIFLGAYDYMSAPDLSALISANAFVVIYLINCFTKLTHLSVQVTDIAGTTHRVVELIETLKQLKCKQELRITSRSDMGGFGWGEMDRLMNSESTDTDPDDTITAFTMDDVTYCQPKSTVPLCSGLNLKFQQGTNVIVTGSSGCGKSSLLRVINGIWPETRGTLDCVINLKPNNISFLPQKPYFTDGSLRQQIVYPLCLSDTSIKTDTSEDAVIIDYLNKAELTNILTRTNGLDTEVDWNWYDELSPGEMQRLSFVRLFYHHPKFAVLDEATSQIGTNAEQIMYNLCRDLNITVLSVGHRQSLLQYHNVELQFDGQGGYSVLPIAQSIN